MARIGRGHPTALYVKISRSSGEATAANAAAEQTSANVAVENPTVAIGAASGEVAVQAASGVEVLDAGRSITASAEAVVVQALSGVEILDPVSAAGVLAELSSASAAAYDVTRPLTDIETTAQTVTANDAVAAIGPAAETVVAQSLYGVEILDAGRVLTTNAEEVAAPVTAYNPVPGGHPVEQTGAVTATAYDVSRPVPAESAAVAVTAYNPVPGGHPVEQTGAVTATANDASVDIGPSAGTAVPQVLAEDATTGLGSSAGTAVAQSLYGFEVLDAGRQLTASAGDAAASGAAYDVSRPVPAEEATQTATSFDAVAAIGPRAGEVVVESLSGVGVLDAARLVGALAEEVPNSATAYTASISITFSAETVTAQSLYGFEVLDAGRSLGAVPDAAAATVTAYDGIRYIYAETVTVQAEYGTEVLDAGRAIEALAGTATASAAVESLSAAAVQVTPGERLISILFEDRTIRVQPGDMTIKDPDSVLDYVFDWTQWLGASENITSSTMTITPGLTLDSSSFETYYTTAWLSGGTVGLPYRLSNRIVTDEGRTDERSIIIRVREL